MLKYFSLSNLSAGFVGVMVGFTSSAVLIFQAATNAGANQAEISSWLLALGISIAATSIGLSLRHRAPILTGWSTPGAALLITSLSGISMPEAIGAFVFSALLTVIAGATGLFKKMMDHIPRSLSAAMMAGILLNFGLNIFTAMQDQFYLVLTMFIAYLFGKRLLPRYVIPLVLLLGIVIAWQENLLHLQHIQFALSYPIFTMPKFSVASLVSIGFPLFIVTMTSQNIPGAAIIQANGYRPPISSLITSIGIATLLLAPFGCYAINLAAITAAICLSPEADSNPKTRYRASVFAGICWIFIGLFSATVVSVFTSLPKALVFSIAGLALLTTIANSLQTALKDEKERDPALITILFCASGVTLFGVGSAFWGLFAGIFASIILKWRTERPLLNSAN